MNYLICKSAFHIQPMNKKNIFIGYTILNDNLSLNIIIECNISKQNLILKYSQWENFTKENTFESIFNNLSTNNHSKSHWHKLDDDFYYRIKTNSDSIILLKDDKRVKLNRDNLYRIRLWNDLIDAKILEKSNKLHMYQLCFKNACLNIKNDISHLPQECHRSDFISSYIQDYKFDFENIEMDEQKTFLLELQKIHHEQFADVLIKSLL